MSKITEFLDKASQAYFSGKPIISDEAFDALSVKVGYDKIGSNDSQEVAHYRQMFSLQKFYEDEGREPPIARNIDTSCSLKLDGAAVGLLYLGGNLVQVATRGDGIKGQDITKKFLKTRQAQIPLTIDFKDPLFVTGEIVASKDITNSRNYAAGSLNLKDIKEFKTRAIVFFAYGVFPYLETTYDEDMSMLSKLGFNTVKDSAELDKIYPSDGIVFRVNNNAVFESMGWTNSHPRGAYALKTRGLAVETKLLGVEWNTGRTGRVTPTAILEPVFIGDKQVSRATLNNPGFIESLDLRLGDTVAVTLSGEIIPTILYKVDA